MINDDPASSIEEIPIASEIIAQAGERKRPLILNHHGQTFKS
jgi:hypothetical protein